MSILRQLKLSLQRLESDPNNKELLHEVGNYLFDLKEWNLANKFYRKYLDIDDHNIEVLKKLAVCYFQLDKYEEYYHFYNSHENLGLKLVDLIELADNKSNSFNLYQALIENNINTLSDKQILVIGSVDDTIKNLLKWKAKEENISAIFLTNTFENQVKISNKIKRIPKYLLTRLPVKAGIFDIIIFSNLGMNNEETFIFSDEESIDLQRVLKDNGTFISLDLDSKENHLADRQHYATISKYLTEVENDYISNPVVKVFKNYKEG